MRKTLLKTLSVALAVIMLVGVLPFVYKIDKSLSASGDIPTVESIETGIIQGPNDAVVFHTGNTNFYYYDNNFAGNIVGKNKNSEGEAFDRIIHVFTKSRTLSTGAINMHGATDYKPSWTGNEKFVFTNKVYVTNLDYVWQISGNTISDGSAYQLGVNDYLSKGKFYLGQKLSAYNDNKAFTLGCDMTWDYFNVDLDTSSPENPVINCNGYDFKIGEHVNFTYDADNPDKSKFTIRNFPARIEGVDDPVSVFNSASATQTIEILTGEYQVIAPFPTEVDCTESILGTLNVTIGRGLVNGEPSVKVLGSSISTNLYSRFAVLANTDMGPRTVINYTLDGVSLNKNFYIFYGRRLTSGSTIAAPVAAGTINLTVKDSTMPLFGATLSSGATLPNYAPLNDDTGLKINAYLSNVKKADGSKLSISLDCFDSNYFAVDAYVSDELIGNVAADNVYSLAAYECEHDFTATASTLGELYLVTLKCKKDGCGFTCDFDADRNGHPAIYVDALTGNDAYFGNTVANAVQSMSRASTLLGEWGVGGTIVVVDAHNNYQYMAEGNDTERIYSAGGPITITSNTSDFVVGEKIDFRETANACWVPLTNVRTTEDIILEDLILVPRNSGTRVLYLSGRDLIVKESCEFRAPANADLYARGTRMQYLETAPTVLSLALISGYNPSAAKAEDVGTQNIVLESGVYKLLGFGNRSSSLDKKEETAMTGNVNVYVGKGVVLNTIDAAPDVSALNPTFVFESGVDYEIATELPTTADVNIKAKADVVNAEKDHVVIVSNENLTFVQTSVKWESGYASVRVEELLNTAWMEENVAELGFFIKEYDNAPFATYFAHAELQNYVSEGVGKSLAYDKDGEINKYFWDGESENVTFRGVLTYDISSGDIILNAHKTFVAVPYARLIDGDYFVNGTPVVFTLKDVCEAIIADDNADVEDKDKAQAILDSIPDFIYPTIQDGFVFGGEEDLLAGGPDLSLLPVTPDIDDSEKTNTFDENNVVLSFGAISDTHVYSTDHGNNVKYPNALQTLNKISGGKLDLIAIAGDMVNINNTSQTQDKIDARAKAEMAMFSMLTKQNTEWMIDPTNVIATTGNHDQRSEFAKQPALYSTYLGAEYYEKDFETNLRAGYRHAVYNGYHFIILDADVIDPYHYGEFNPAVLNWLDQRLAVITEQSPDKYVFIITHAGVDETSYGTEDAYQPGSNRWTSETLGAVVEKYPQVIIFTGHTHTPIFDERSIAQSGFTAVNCGAVANTSLELDVYFNHVNNEEPVLGNEYISTGHYVQVDASGNVRITRILFPNYDTTSDVNQEYQTIKTPWELEYPKADGSHLEKYELDTRREANEAPVLTGEISAVASGNANDVILTVPAGNDDDFVHHFDIVVTNADTGAVIEKYKMVTDFICRANADDMLDEYSFRVPCAQANCKITVTAVDSWGERSDSLTTTIDLSAVVE